MSSMRNAVQRRNHKERAQPLERQKWGLLEKHKDYSLRAKDHNEKKRRLKVLRQKVAERNPDEFAFGMISRTTKKGVQQAQRGKDNGTQGPMKMDVAKLLKTQDAGYLQTVLQQTRRAREKVEKHAVLLASGVDASSLSKKTVFDEDGEVVQEKALQSVLDDEDDMDFDMDDLADLGDLDGLDDLDGLSGGASEDGKSEDAESESETEGLSKEEIRQRRKKKRAQEVLQNQLVALKDREGDLTAALRQLQEQRARMSNTVGGVNKNGVKFKIRERKR